MVRVIVFFILSDLRHLQYETLWHRIQFQTQDQIYTYTCTRVYIHTYIHAHVYTYERSYINTPTQMPYETKD